MLALSLQILVKEIYSKIQGSIFNNVLYKAYSADI